MPLGLLACSSVGLLGGTRKELEQDDSLSRDSKTCSVGRLSGRSRHIFHRGYGITAPGHQSARGSAYGLVYV